MLESMRNQAQSWIAKVILGGVALSFVMWGIGDYFNNSGNQAVAEVDGTPISNNEFYLAYERQLNTYRALLGKQFSKKAVAGLGLKEKTLQTLINRHLIEDEAQDMGLVAPKDVLLATVHSNPQFQSAGNFDARRYQILTRNMGFRTPIDYEASLRMDLIATAMQQALLQSAIVSDAEVRTSYAREFEQREFEALVVEPSAMRKNITISDAQARKYFTAHQNKYRSPLRLTLNAVIIDPQKMTDDIAVDDADIEAAYNENKDRYKQAETRHVRHILIKLSKNADAASIKAAHAKIEKALKEIKSGASFAKVAKRISEDKANAKNGGDLGYLPRGATVPAFDKALFSLAKGEVSDVIQTQFGLHILKLEDIKPERIKPLSEVRDALRKQLALSKADEEAYRLSQDLDDALGREDNLKAAADSINLKVQHFGPMSIAEARAYSIFSDGGFRSSVFTKRPGDTVDVSEQGKGRFVAIEVVKRDEPANLPFEKVTKQVYDDALQAAARNKARQLAEKLLKQAENKELPALGQQYGLPLYLSKPVRSNGTGDSNADWLTRTGLEELFNLSENAVANHVMQVPKGYAIIKVKRILKADNKDFAKRQAAIRKQLLKTKGSVRFARWMADTRSRHDIQIHPKVLERF